MTAAELSLGQINGEATEMMMDYYEERAKGGVGMIITGCCRVDDMNPASFTQLAMTHDYHIPSVRKLGVEVRLNTLATADSILAMNPYAVVVTTDSCQSQKGRITLQVA